MHASNADLPHLLGAFVVAFVVGAINSVAGGGTLISFPMLVALGLPPVVANATNTVGIWPGSLGSMWGFRREMRGLNPRIRWLLIPALAGGGAGALLLLYTPAATFEHLVPILILLATVLFMVQGPAQRALGSVSAARHAGGGWLAAAILVQLAVAVYGGYFGAGMSIMMLSILGLLGMTDILQMSATTSLLACAVNGVAGILFLCFGLVSVPFALVMAAGSLAGGYGGAGIARRIGRPAVRRFVIAVGLTITTVLVVRMIRRG